MSLLPNLFRIKNLNNHVSFTKGSEILEGLLLSQYKTSPNMREYLAAFIEEMNYLFEQIDRVYFGRMLEFATGVQLDLIGEILQRSRSVELPTSNFGFQGATLVQGFADEAFPSVGGVFLSEESQGFEITPLDDATYRRTLLTKAFSSNRDTLDINDTYIIISTLIGRVLQTLSLEYVTDREAKLTISSSETSDSEVQLIVFASKWYLPTGTILSVDLVA